MKKDIIKTLLLLIVLILAITYTIAWVENRYIKNQDIIGKSGNSNIDTYFDGGSGTEESPYSIGDPEQFFNLSYLQNNGDIGETPYYFELADDFGGSICLDFATEIEITGVMFPIGSAEHPFNGIFDGNFSAIKNLTIDGNGEQDIGMFGYLGPDAVVKNLFLENITILSEPPGTTDTSGFHPHDLNTKNIATGFVAGHKALGATIENVFVMSPLVVSLNNEIKNRTQYGLIGFDESNLGITVGSPDSAYDFDFNSTFAYNELVWALGQYGTWYINGSATLTLADVLHTSPATSQKLKIDDGYSLSSLKISQTASDPNPTHLYDQMVIDDHYIGSESTGYFIRQYLDLVGEVLWVESGAEYLFNINANTKITIPYINDPFDPTDYDNTIVLYIKPTPDLNALGTLTAVTTGGGGLSLYVGGTPGDSNTNYSINSSGGENILSSAQSFCMVDVDLFTGEMTVTDSNPDYYVFLVGIANGSSTVREIHFNFIPSGLNEESLGSIYGLDYIIECNDFLDTWNEVTQEYDYDFTYMNFSYIISPYQSLIVRVDRMQNTDPQGLNYSTTAEFRFIFYGDPDTTYIPITILNVKSTHSYNIEVYQVSDPNVLDHTWVPTVGVDTPIYTGSNDLIEIEIISTSSSNVTYSDY
jgi:hypothetical protein